jgi:hypothetical protein
LRYVLPRAAVLAAASVLSLPASDLDLKPKQPHLRELRPSGGVFYHGGPVLAYGVNLYYIWYGNWSADAEAAAILTTFAQGLGGSPYFNINSSYHGMAGGRDVQIANAVRFGGSYTDNYSQGRNLADGAVAKIVAGAINSGQLPADPNGVYFVLGSADVTEPGFCKSSCGFHGFGTLVDGTLRQNQTDPAGIDIKFAFVGNPATQCQSFCSLWGPNFPPPNGNPGGDAMVSIVAHELNEAVEDPHMDAWFDINGAEGADKCQWTYGNISRVPAGQPNAYGVYNMTLAGRNFLIQQNWINSGAGFCGTVY